VRQPRLHSRKTRRRQTVPWPGMGFPLAEIGEPRAIRVLESPVTVVTCEIKTFWLYAASNGKRIVNILTRTAAAKRLAPLCVALLLIAMVAQGAHFCGFRSFDLPAGGSQLRADSSNTTLCLTCLMAQSVAAIVLAIAFSSIFRRRLHVSLPQMRPRAFLSPFHLYVRPPPIF
jgi:hypothetical protein